MHSKAGMWHHVGSTMKIVRNTLFVVGGKGEKGRLRTILLVTAIAATQEGEEVLRSITLPLHGKNKWLSNSSIQKKTGPNNGTKVVSKEAIRMQQTGALLWLYAWRNEAGNPTLQLYHQKSEEHEH